jgi:hypothetical protein
MDEHLITAMQREKIFYILNGLYHLAKGDIGKILIG